MSSEWAKTQTIGELLAREGGSIKTGPFGTALKASEYADIGVPLISVREIGHGTFHIDGKTPRVCEATLSRLPEYILQKGDIVFARKGGIERCALIRKPQSGWFLGSDGIRLRPPMSCDARFIAYSLQTTAVKDWLVQNSTGSTMASLNQATIGRLPIALPVIQEQTRIADVLETFDDRIALLRETNATLEAIAQALFKSWFVDFDPVHAKARGEDPEALPEDLAALFPDSFEESPLGLVPRGWKLGTLNDLAILNPESWSAKAHPETVAYVDLANAKDNVIAEITEFSFDEAPSRARRVLRDGDTIVGTVRPGNRSFAFISQASPNLTGSTGFAVLRPRQEENTEFLYLSATADSSIEYLAHVADGGAYPAVRSEVVSNLQCFVPNADVLQAFHETAAPIFAKIAANHQQSQTISSLRNTLLPRLISGALRLPGGEVIIEEEQA